jgi:hypothetical protein
MRIQVERIKRSPANAQRLERQLCGRDGIERVVPNLATGTVVVLYDPDRIGEPEIVHALGGMANMQNHREGRPTRQGERPLRDRVAENVVAGLLEIAVRGLISALA